MTRCKATTRTGRACHNTARSGRRYCHAHKNLVDLRPLLSTCAGALIGNLAAPGIGGIAGGAAVGAFLGKRDSVKSKVFVSFDFDNDRALKDFILGQARLNDSPFEVVDHSLKEAAPERDWESKAERAIARCDVVIILVGPNTYRAQGVLKEIELARSKEKRIVQVIGYKDGNYRPVPGAGRLYRWTWENLKTLLQ